MIGCLKQYDFPVPDIESRYFVPEYFRTETIFPPYYSGAGYVMTQEAMKKVTRAVPKTDLFHLDDVYIGKLIKSAQLSGEMATSLMICSGVGGIGRKHLIGKDDFNVTHK